MNCCFIVLLLLVLGNCNSSCQSSCIEPRRNTRTECDTNPCVNSILSDNLRDNRFSKFGMDNDDCGCRN